MQMISTFACVTERSTVFLVYCACTLTQTQLIF